MDIVTQVNDIAKHAALPGIRAALCHDAETTKGARIWNHANVLALSVRAIPMRNAGTKSSSE